MHLNAKCFLTEARKLFWKNSHTQHQLFSHFCPSFLLVGAWRVSVGCMRSWHATQWSKFNQSDSVRSSQSTSTYKSSTRMMQAQHHSGCLSKIASGIFWQAFWILGENRRFTEKDNLHEVTPLLIFKAWMQSALRLMNYLSVIVAKLLCSLSRCLISLAVMFSHLLANSFLGHITPLKFTGQLFTYIFNVVVQSLKKSQVWGLLFLDEENWKYKMPNFLVLGFWDTCSVTFCARSKLAAMIIETTYN